MASNKIVVIGDKSRSKMLDGVNVLADAVGATLGPRGRNVAIAREWGPPLITKDGVTVAQHIFLEDPLEDMGAQLVKSVSAYANSIAGDGTTTATVLAQSFYSEGIKVVEEDFVNPVLLKRGIDIGVKKVVGRLRGLSASVSSESAMRSVAIISSNNDEELGTLIASAIATVGNSGVVSVGEATGSSTSVSYTEGLKIDKGFLSEHLIDDTSRVKTVLENCFIIPFNGKMNSLRDAEKLITDLIDPMLNPTQNPFLFIVKDLSKEALEQFISNRVKGVFRGMIIRSSGFGDARRAFLEDVALLTGGKLYSDDDGIGLSEITLSDLGVAEKVTVSINSTMIVGGRGDKDKIKEEAESLRSRIENDGLHDHQLGVLHHRLSRLTGIAAEISVGGATDSEVRERRDRIEDAINAVRSAIEEGVVPGGGSSLIHASVALDDIDLNELLSEERVGVSIVRKVVEAPFRKILLNSGIEDPSEYISLIKEANGPAGFNALSMTFEEDMLKAGIMDPTKVVRSAFEHAASAASTLLTTEVSIYNTPDTD